VLKKRGAVLRGVGGVALHWVFLDTIEIMERRGFLRIFVRDKKGL
jgi:hypothetical protein